jgi:hypothetical protein
MVRKHTIMLAALAAGACFSAGAASASTVCVNATQGSHNFGPDASCSTTAESEVFLQDAKDTMTGFGNIGSHTGLPLVEFTSTADLDLSRGSATIDPAAKTGFTSFPNLDITIPGHKFTDLLFTLEMVDTGVTPEVLTLTAWFGSTKERTLSYLGLPHDAAIDFTVADAAGLTAVDLSTTTGIKEAKHFDVSGVAAIPEPSTWALMVVGFAGLGYTAFRRGRVSRMSGALA